MDINELIAIVKKKLKDQIKIESINIEDKSFLHKNHAGNQEGKFHLKINLKSIELKEMKRIESNKKIYKILDKDLNYDSSKYGEWDAEANGGLSFDEYYNKFMLKVYQLSKKLHGLSGSRTSLKGKDTVWGRVLFLFKPWLPETFASR